MFIHENDNWPNFRWDESQIAPLNERFCRRVGQLYGRLGTLGFESQLKAMAENMSYEVVYSSEIEGVRLNIDQVRSSIARRLGLDNIKETAPSHYIDSIVGVMLDAVENFDKPLSKDKLCAWQAAFFPGGFSECSEIEIGRYRSHEEHIVSGMFGRERIHYIAPSPQRVEEEMERFLLWFNHNETTGYATKSAIAHFWFVSIHPFEDGNGRIARILSEMLLAKGDESRYRFYNISSQINKDKKHYYDILERMQRGNGDLTEWLEWYLQKLMEAVDEASSLINGVLNKSFFWQRASSIPLSERQVNILNMFLDGYEAKITSKTWANLAKCSRDTAIRDIQDLVEKNLLVADVPGSKRPCYSIVYNPDDIMLYFSEIAVNEENGKHYLTAVFKGNFHVRERILKLDAERFENGELSPANLLSKYCSFLLRQ